MRILILFFAVFTLSSCARIAELKEIKPVYQVTPGLTATFPSHAEAFARAVADRAYDLGVAAGIEHANAQAREPYTPEERASIKATIKATIKAIRALKP